MTPKFTVVLVAGGRADLAAHTLQTVAWQAHREWELVVVEDGPRPAARAAFDALVRPSPYLAPRCRYVELAGPGGAAGPWGHALRRHGLALAGGAYVVWADAGDLLHPECLALHAENARQGGPCVSAVPVDCWAGPEYRGRLPAGRDGLDRPRAGAVPLLALALPAGEARAAEAFHPRYDAVKEAGHHAHERLAAHLPVRLNGRLAAAARFLAPPSPAR